jgi:hypothetical protein
VSFGILICANVSVITTIIIITRSQMRMLPIQMAPLPSMDD